MGAQRYEQRYSQRHGYMESVEGNTVRKWEAAPAKEGYVRPVPQKRERVAPAPQSHPIQSIDVFSLLFMTAAVAITLYFCITYIQVQHNISNMEKKIAVTESKINDLKNENDAAYNKINTSVDLDYVYKVAVRELGMVRTDKSQVMTYASVKSDYVRQYGRIPEEKKSGLERILTKGQ